MRRVRVGVGDEACSASPRRAWAAARRPGVSRSLAYAAIALALLARRIHAAGLLVVVVLRGEGSGRRRFRETTGRRNGAAQTLHMMPSLTRALVPAIGLRGRGPGVGTRRAAPVGGRGRAHPLVGAGVRRTEFAQVDGELADEGARVAGRAVEELDADGVVALGVLEDVLGRERHRCGGGPESGTLARPRGAAPTLGSRTSRLEVARDRVREHVAPAVGRLEDEAGLRGARLTPGTRRGREGPRTDDAVAAPSQPTSVHRAAAGRSSTG